jgi:hypothetical protein
MAESDKQNVNRFDLAVNSLAKYYKSADSDELQFLMGRQSGYDQILMDSTNAYTDVGALMDKLAAWIDGSAIVTLPSAQVRALNSLLRDSTEGGYFVADIVESGSINETILKDLISSIGDIETPEEIEDVEMKDIVQIFYQSDVSTLECFDTKNNISDLVNQNQLPNDSSTTESSDFIVNDGESSKFGNPGLAAFVLPSHKFSIATRNTDAVSLFLNYVPTTEMSRCTPFLDIKLITEVPPSLQEGRERTTTGMSILDYLGANTADGDKSGIGLVTTVFSEYKDLIDKEAKEGTSAQISGMELFTSPQTMINYDSGLAWDPMKPFMTLDQIRFDMVSLNFALLCNATGEMKFTLHDRKRLRQIAPLVSPDRFGTTYLSVEYGWSHPEGDDPDKNPFGYLINSMRTKANYNVMATNFSIGNDGQVKLTVRLANRPVFDAKGYTVACGRCMPIAPIRSLVQNLIGRHNAIANQEADTIGANSRVQEEIRPVQDLLVDNPVGAGSMIPRALFKSVIGATSSEGSVDTEKLFEDLKAINEGTLDEAVSVSILSEINAKQERLRVSTVDPFWPAAFHTMQNDSFLLKATQAGNTLVPTEGGSSTGDWAEPRSPTNNNFISLGAVLLEFVGSPLAATGKYDEVQMFFYRTNSKSGAARLYDSIASFVINLSDLDAMILNKMVNGTMPSSIERFVDVINEEILSDHTNPNYGLYELAGLETATADVGLAENLKQVQEQFSAACETIYKEGGGEPDFVPPRIAMYLEDVPRIVPGTAEVDNFYMYKPAKPQITDKSKSIMRVHIYDLVASPYEEEGFLLGTSCPKELKARITNYNGITRPWRPMGDNKVLNAAITTDMIYAIRKGESSTGEIASYSMKDADSSIIKEFIKQNMPSLTVGYGFSGIKTFNMQSSTSGEVNNTLLVRNAVDNSSESNSSNSTVSIDPITVIPASVTMTTLGCPIIEYGSQFFIDTGTGTTADNIYTVNKISHTLAPGRFETSLGLGFYDQGTIKNLRARLVASQEEA